MTIAFDALTVMTGYGGPSVEMLLAEIREAVPIEILERPLVSPETATIDTATLRSRRVSSPGEMETLLQRSLLRRSCDALDGWCGNAIVIARAGLHADLLQRLRERNGQYLIASYREATTPCGDFHLAGFGDYDAEGSVCWNYARGDDESVLVLCEFAEYGDWWRPMTAAAEPLLCRPERNRYGNWKVDVVYRVRSADVLRALWSRASYDDGIASYCGPGSAPPAALLDAAIPIRNEQRALVEFARTHGWIYTQRYGGGADEHYALFAARDPHLTRRVYEHAVQRAASDDGWWAAGLC